MLIYRLSGADADSFAIDASSGQIQTKEGITYDYEAHKTCFVTVEVNDREGGIASIAVIIQINDVKEPPSSPPSNFWVRPDNESLTVHFSAVSDEQGRPPVRGYHAEIRRGENGPWGTRKTIYGRTNTSVYYHHIDPEGYHSRILVNGQLYQVRVRAYNSEGESDWSEPVSGIPVYVPPKPKEIRRQTKPEQFQDVDNLVRAEIGISDITGEGGRIIVPQASLPASISAAEVEGIVVEIARVEVSSASDVPASAGFTLLGSSSIFDINLKAHVNDREVDIGNELTVPVEICLPVPDGISNPVMVRYNDESNEWERLDNQRVNGNVICALTDRFSLFGVGKRVEVTAEQGQATEGICDRTSQVQTAILSEIDGVSDCGLVTNAHLASITGPLILIDKGITTLKANDFSNLSSLETLRLQDNSLTAFPADVFSDLSSLTTLRLDNNDLSTLSAGVFSDLSSLTTLNLQANDLSTLSAGVFSDLSSLETLNLKANNLSTLPAGIFVGLSSLTSLDLRENPGAEFTLTLQLDRTDADDAATGPATVKVVVAQGAPFEMTVSLSVTNGTLSASSATIAAGSIESDPITVTQTGTGRVTVSLEGPAPTPPMGTSFRKIKTALGSTPLILFPALPVPTFSRQTIADQTYALNSKLPI